MRLVWLLLAASLMAGLGCSDNKEETPARECVEDSDCGEDRVCLTSVGTCHECIGNQDCAEGFICRSLECVPDPEVDAGEDADMPNNDPGDTGDPDADAEEPDDVIPDDAEDATDDVDEPDDVDPDDAEDDVDEPDVPDEPEDCDPTCPGLQICDLENNTCLEPRLCLTDVDCIAPNVCFDNRCLGQAAVEQAGGCFTDASCEDQGEFLFCNLEGHRCLPSGRCNSDNECPGDLVCDPTGLCRQCADDGDCPGGLTCNTENSAYVCVEPESCANSDDCRGDRECRSGSCREPSCNDDGFEPNNACDAATEIMDGTFPNRRICGSDCDWYSLDVQPGDGFVARIDHNPERGDLDLTLHGGPCNGDDPGPLLERSASLQSSEIISVPRSFSQNTYYFSVCPFVTDQDGGTNDYELDVLNVPGGFCVDDVYDENRSNDEPIQASQLTITERPFNFRVSALQVCPGAGDWYRLQLQEGDFLTVSIELNDTFGDLDLKVFDRLPFNEFEPALVESVGRNNVESVSTAVDRNGEYYIFVGSPVDGQNLYEMTIEVVDECTDAFEPNNSVDDAADLSGLPPSTFNGLRLCSSENDIDWYTSTVNPGEAVVVTVRYDENAGQDVSAQVLTRPGEANPAVLTGSAGVLAFPIVPSDNSRQVFFGLEVTGDDLTYSLSYEVRSADEICLEDARNNRTLAQATTADFGVREYRGTLCPNGDAPGTDYFAIDVPDNTWVFANIQNAAPGLNVQILDGNDEVLSDGNEDTFGRTAFFQAETGGQLFVRITGQTVEDQGEYVLQIYSQPAPEGPECTDDFLEGEVENDAWEDGREISTGTWFRNLLLCPTDADWYKFFVIAGENISITIQTHQPVAGAISARVYDIFGPPFAFINTVESENGVLQININGIEVFDGGEWALEIFSEELETVWYDVRVITN